MVFPAWLGLPYIFEALLPGKVCDVQRMHSPTQRTPSDSSPKPHLSFCMLLPLTSSSTWPTLRHLLGSNLTLLWRNLPLYSPDCVCVCVCILSSLWLKQLLHNLPLFMSPLYVPLYYGVCLCLILLLFRKVPKRRKEHSPLT